MRGARRWLVSGFVGIARVERVSSVEARMIDRAKARIVDMGLVQLMIIWPSGTDDGETLFPYANGRLKPRCCSSGYILFSFDGLADHCGNTAENITENSPYRQGASQESQYKHQSESPLR